MTTQSTDDLTGVSRVEYGHRVWTRDYFTWVSLDEQNSYWISIFDTTLLRDSPYDLKFRVTDFAGNVIESDTLLIFVDNTAPSVEFINPVNASSFNGVTELMVLSDDDNGVESVEFRVKGTRNSFDETFSAEKDPQGQWTVTLDTPSGSDPLTDGLYEITVRSTDFAGNAHSSSIEVTVDNTNPSIQVPFPHSGTFSGYAFTSAYCYDSHSGVASVEFGYGNSDSGVRWIPGRGNGDEIWISVVDTSMIDPGSYNLSVRVTDAAGNVEYSYNFSEVTFNRSAEVFDSSPPNISLIHPESDDFEGVLLFQAVSNDGITEIGISGVETRDANVSGVRLVEFGYSSDGRDVKWFPGKAVGRDTWNGSLDTTGLEDGSYLISVRSTDYADNVNQSLNVVEVLLDNNPPLTELISPIDFSNVTGTLELLGRTSDNGVGVERAWFEINGINGFFIDYVTATEDSEGDWSATFDSSTLEDGVYDVTFHSVDLFDNEAFSVSRIRIDSMQPDVSLLAPVAGTFSGVIKFSALVNDSLSRVESVEFGYRRRGVSKVKWLSGSEKQNGLWERLLNTGGFTNGVYNLSVRSTDYAGNQKTIEDVLENNS